MAKYAFTVMATPKPGTDDDYNDWHKNKHVGDVLDLPGFISAKRYRLADVSKGGATTWNFFTIYEVETDDPEAVLAEMGRRYGTDQMPKTDLSDPTKTVSVMWALDSEH